MYHLTHPVDLSKFLKYIDDSEPFDLVIDGMNLFFVPVKMRRMAKHKRAGVSANKDNPTKVESMQQKELRYRLRCGKLDSDLISILPRCTGSNDFEIMAGKVIFNSCI